MVDEGQPIRELSYAEAAVALALPTAVVTFVESIELAVAGRLMPATHSSMFVLQHGHWLLCLGIAFSSAWTCKFGGQGVLATFAGTAIALFSIFRFRGPHEWYGTFTVYDRDPRFWQLAILIGLASGAAYGITKGRLNLGEKVNVVAPFLFLVTTTAICWFDSKFPSMNPFVPTRHWAMLVLLISVTCAVSYQAFKEKESNETQSLFTH